MFAVLHPKQGNLLQKEHFYRTQPSLSLQHQIGWRPAEKNSLFFSTGVFLYILRFQWLGYILGIVFHKPIWGRCYDHNFLRFSPIFGEKLAPFSKHNVMISFFHNLALFCVKNANFFADFFGKNIFF
jgi:hypothetical protein